MTNTSLKAASLLGFALLCVQGLQAQTLTIAPSGSVTVGLGASVQFSAVATGFTIAAIKWEVANVQGGSAATGTITTGLTGGLYTAPTSVPAQNPQSVLVVVTDTSGTKHSASTYVTILPPPPVITSVSPSPLPPGTATVTVTGTGFGSSGAVIWDGGVQYSTQQPAAGTLTASVYTPPGTASASFTVHGNGAVSNAVVVPVGTAASTYALTVVNGTGSGTYAAGAVVNIAANAPPAGEQFQSWSGATVAGTTSATTTLTMPAANTTVTAQFVSAALVISSVSPNPLPSGTVTVLITGTGFTSSSTIWDGGVQYATQQPAPNTLSASIYTAPGTASVTFTVHDPAGLSNQVTVPVSGPPSYTLTVVNGTGGGTYTAGTAVTITAGTPPSGETFQAWTGAVVANPQAGVTSITMPSSDTTVTANYYTPAPVPFPVTTHPRLWITQQDLPHLQNWATSSNIAYQGLLGPLGTAIGNYNAAFPGAALNAVNPVPASPYPDLGDDQGYTGMLTEENAVILAFNSLIDPSPSNRASYAQAARNLLMYAMNQAALGPLSGAPFRDPSFPISNRGSWSSHEWPLIVDWIYPILSASDKATIRSVFLTWAAECLTAETTGGDNPGTPNLENSLALLTYHGQTDVPYRMSSNNYYLAHARLLTMISLALDPADDPPVNPALPSSAPGNTLRSYIPDATGAWLYEEFAMMGDPQVVAQAYNVPNNPSGAGFGLASGGLPPEGMLYGESFGYILGQLLALQTAGFNSPALSGPQIGMIGAPVWDRYVQGYLSSLVPAPQTFASESYLGSVYQYAGFGDLLRTYVTPDFMTPFSLLGLLDQENGSSSHVNAARWFALNATPGGASALLTRMTDPWTWGVTQDLLYYMLLDPAAPAPTDPRPGYPTTFFDAPQGRIVAHSDWTPMGNMFDFKAGWTSINHQDGNGGQFELYRKGEWLTKEMSNYDSGGNGNGATVTYHNTLGLQNWCGICSTQTINWQGPDGPTWANGGQWMEGGNAGDPTTIMSTGPGYVYANSDLTNLYNKPNEYSPTDSVSDTTIADILEATRSILWLNNDYIVVYDRATSGHNGFKRFNLSLVTQPVISGNTAVETLASGQQLFVQTLLPLTPSLSSFYGPATLSAGALADLEPTQYIYQVQDPANPLDTRFLHVLQGADAGAPMVTATRLQSTSGTAFDGAQFGQYEVWFPVSAGAAFGGSTFPAPAGVRNMIVTGLSPNAAYTVTVQPASNGNTVSVFPGGTAATADSAGVLNLSF